MSAATVLVFAVAAALSSDGTLTGKVQDEAGTPIAGAIVDIYTAKPRVGAAITCPSCYRDCARSTKTDGEGQFTLSELDSGLLFRVLVMAPGERSRLTEWIDPQTTELDVKLKPIPKEVSRDRRLTGRVLDDQGKPLAGAVVSPSGAKTREGRWWGQLPGVDEASITDVDGRFVILSEEPKLGLDLGVSAPGFADFPAKLFELTGREHEIRIQRGAAVLGKLTFEGQPVSHTSLGIVQRERSLQTFVGERVVVTDNQGRFQFTDLQPNQQYVLYTLCRPIQVVAASEISAEVHPALRTQTLAIAGSGELTDLGELTLMPGLTLAGRVIFPDHAELPDGVKVRLDRDPAWDWSETTLLPSGDFSFHGLPPEVYSISVHAPGFEIDASQSRHQLAGPSELVLRLRSDAKANANVSIRMRPVDQ